jgi:hypothetical protein
MVTLRFARACGIVVTVLALHGAGCSAAPPSVPPPQPPAALRPAKHCDYTARLESLESSELTVEARCDGNSVRAFVASESSIAHLVQVVTADGTAIERKGPRFTLPHGAPAAITYRMSLDDVSSETASIDVAYRSGRAWVVAVSTWILRPERLDEGAIIDIHVETPPEAGFSTGLARSGDHWFVDASEIRFATYSVFGRYRSDRFQLPGPFALEPGAAKKTADIEVVTLPGELAVPADVRLEWVRDAARAVSDFWHGFPVEHALLMLLPTPGTRTVAHGKVVAAGGAGVAIHLGAEAQRGDLYRDWILVHELFHLGFPSFWGEGKWLDEGLATYYEPIIRARAHWYTPATMWAEFARDMDQGLDAVERLGLERAQSFRDIYWGGCIIALLADVETRRRTDGRLGLEDGLRAVLRAGGNATQLWSLERALSVIDQGLGEPTMKRLSAAHLWDGTPVDLPGLFTSLGVTANGHPDAELDDAAQLSAVRRAIVEPTR